MVLMPRRLGVLFFSTLLFPSFAWAQGEPLGPEFRINTYTTNRRARWPWPG